MRAYIASLAVLAPYRGYGVGEFGGARSRWAGQTAAINLCTNLFGGTAGQRGLWEHALSVAPGGRTCDIAECASHWPTPTVSCMSLLFSALTMTCHFQPGMTTHHPLFPHLTHLPSPAHVCPPQQHLPPPPSPDPPNPAHNLQLASHNLSSLHPASLPALPTHGTGRRLLELVVAAAKEDPAIEEVAVHVQVRVEGVGWGGCMRALSLEGEVFGMRATEDREGI